MKYISIIACVFVSILSSCVSSKKFQATQQELNNTNEQLVALQTKCNDETARLTALKNEIEKENSLLSLRIEDMTNQNRYLKENNTQALTQLENLSVISKQQAESIRRSMDNIGVKDAYIQTLQKQISYKDSLNMALVMNLQGAIGNLNDEDINIKVEKGVVYVDISDKLLFKSGSYNVTDKAKRVLAKVAAVLKNQPEIEFMVEGHTDNVPFKGNGILLDNWDLSVKRSTTIVRLLQLEFGIPADKMSAAGRGEYSPLAANDSAEGRAANRRTRIVILPQLDQFFQLLEMK